MKAPPKPAEPLPSGDSRPTSPPVSSKDLLRGATMLEIDHAGQTYFLRVTRENKLILTK
jgi:hemin uptake protein HemP